jgi:hypothetical protein
MAQQECKVILARQVQQVVLAHRESLARQVPQELKVR